MIEAITDFDAPSLRNALSQLVDAGILHQRGSARDMRFTFRHALLQDTAYGSQRYPTRRALHARIEEAPQERFPARVEAEEERNARKLQGEDK